MYRLPDNRLLKPHKSFVLNDVFYSKGWLKKATAQELSDLGITWEDQPAPVVEVKPVTIEDVARERARRLAIPFEYDFEDERGVHLIGTTKEDREGWGEVTDLANALIDQLDVLKPIPIVTNTGPTYVTGPEWQAIIEYAADEIRQPIWAASFALQAMNPIPQDYRDVKYWPQSTHSENSGGVEVEVTAEI